MTDKNDVSLILAAGAAISENHRQIAPDSSPFTIVPEGYAVKTLEHTLAIPTRKRGDVSTRDADSFCAYVCRHANSESMMYADLDYELARFTVVCVLNDDGVLGPGWRDHTCTLDLGRSVEWRRWNAKTKVNMNQGEFAAWLEDNLGDVLSADGMPNGSDMLQMAIGFERTSEKRLKSKINLQSGGFRFEYVDDEDKDTRTSMQVFDRFAIAVPVFEGSNAAYRIDARLKYRDNSGKLSFWFELIRPDRTFKQAVDDEVAKIAKDSGLTIICGRPGAA